MFILGVDVDAICAYAFGLACALPRTIGLAFR